MNTTKLASYDKVMLAFSAEALNQPSEIQVIPYGKHKTEKGAFVLDEACMDEIILDFGMRENDMVVDYEHQTLSGTEAPAAGWIKSLLNKGKHGLWATVVWTPKALEYLRNKEYKYLSPVFLKRLSDNCVVKLINAALTNQPAIDGMVPLVNKGASAPRVIGASAPGKIYGWAPCGPEAPAPAYFKDAVSSAHTSNNNEKEVNSMQRVLSLLGLKEDAGFQEVEGTVEALKKGHALSTELGQKVQELQMRLREFQAEGLVANAMKEGKVTPAQHQWAIEFAMRDTEAFEVFASKAPVALPQTVYSDGYSPGRPEGLTGMQKSVNRALGISDECFVKFGEKKEEA